MAYRRAPQDLTLGFYEAVVLKAVGGRRIVAGCYFAGVGGDKQPCEGVVQACHVVRRQTVRRRLRELLWPCAFCDCGTLDDGPCLACGGVGLPPALIDELVLLAEWDDRNALPGCEHVHHARFDGRRGPRLLVPHHRLPDRAIEFALDWGLETELEDRCPPNQEV